MASVVTFNKSYEERLQEYTDVLKPNDSSKVCGTDIQNIWSRYLQLNIHPSGWLALWKMPRTTCEVLKVRFPITVVVCVKDVDFPNLRAAVKTLAVDGQDVLANSNFIVSLIELWPTKQQDVPVQFNSEATADALDMLRIFYIYLFMPWDLDEDSSTDWLIEHLETRLTLFYEIRTDCFPKYKAVLIKELLTEAQYLHLSQKQLIEDDPNIDLSNIKARMLQIKGKIELLENPLSRNALIRKEQQLMMPQKPNSSTSVSLVLPVGPISDYISFLNEAKTQVGGENVQYKSSLSNALADARANETILLCKSTHTYENSCFLQEGTFKGLYTKDDTVVTSTKEDIMLDLFGNLTFENLTIDISTAHLGILVRRGTVTLKDCKLICSSQSHSQDGVIVDYGGILNMHGCDISGFDRAIVVNSGGTLHLENSTVVDNNVGLRLHDDSFVKIESTKFLKCEDCGIDIATNEVVDEDQRGTFEVLKMYSLTSLIVENIIGQENGVDCSITQVKKVDLIEDLGNQTDDSSSDDELDTTVLNLYV